MEIQNAYQILGLRKGASSEDLKKVHAELVKKYDPERHTDRFMAIEAAYEKLRDPVKRAHEDILTFNYVQGGFKFTADEQTHDPDAIVNQLIQEQEQKYSRNPENVEAQAGYIKALMMRSFKKYSKKLWAEAIEDWQRILNIDPTQQRAKSNLLYAYAALGYSFADHALYDEAIDLWEKAIQMNPDDDKILHNLAIGCEKAGKNDQSKKYWSETLRRWDAKLKNDPDDVYTRNCIIEVRRYHGTQASASKENKESPAISIAEYKEILKINPNDFEAQYKIATAMYEQRNWAEAVKALTNLMKLYPKNSEVLNMLGWSLLQSGQYEQAFQIWNRSLTIDPKNASTREAIIKARMDVGKAFRSRGMHTQALVNFKALLKYLPQSAEVYLEIGQTYMSKGDKRSAAIAFEQVMQLDPKNRSAKQFMSDMKLRS